MTDIFTTGPDDQDLDDHEPTGRRKRHMSGPVKTLVILASVLVGILVTVGVIGGVYAMNLARSYDQKTTKIPQAFPDESTRPVAPTDGSMNILLMGSDSRADATSIDEGGPSDQRTDTMMLMHVDADRKKVYVMSIMRDLWVPIPGHGEAKINAAFAYGGAPLTVQTVEQLLQTRIDHVAIIDFEGFKGMTDALGGVDVFSQKRFTARGTTIVPGLNHLAGDDALNFVRERYAFTDGDYTRVENQQAFMTAIVDKVISRDTLTDPAKISAFVDSVSEYLSVDDTLDAGTLANLGVSLRGLAKEDIDFFTVPTAGTGTSADGQSIVNLDTALIPRLQAALKDDAMESFMLSVP
ncbi:LCP family protein [Frigoribacterium sp. VKM Ac-2836]|uniref:LCP family protein n=1 Tax=Frigoribacterium sp. VKM Ac-2836 TaxID=2739014 RepID=UPI001564DC12|nr:LCP family protein [Frigoribacterium sp. VKM Ac-2836]NRD27282.1 LCP family protein [Frigoribacterium sp. VKM Ac-2836]